MIETHASLGDPADVGRRVQFGDKIGIGANGLLGAIVREDPDDIGLIIGLKKADGEDDLPPYEYRRRALMFLT